VTRALAPGQHAALLGTTEELALTVVDQGGGEFGVEIHRVLLGSIADATKAGAPPSPDQQPSHEGIV
jgi:hypothetical protein